jgi:hypothetical protein
MMTFLKAAAALVVLGAFLLFGGLMTALTPTLTSPTVTPVSASGGDQPSKFALKDIPGPALRDYRDAAATVCPGLSWTVVAGIGKVETDHGRSTLPGVHSGTNFAGAAGPMQFLLPTWSAEHLPGMTDVYDHRAASFGAANYLCHNGGTSPAKLHNAIFAYNHADWYVQEVLDWARQYLADPTTPTSSVEVVSPGDPFAGTCKVVVTQWFGPTDLSLEPAVFGVAHFHTGIDLACPAGEPIHTLTSGLAHVTGGCQAGFFPCGGFWGNNVVIEVKLKFRADATPQIYFIRYAHMLVPTVADGTFVRAGDIIGLEGTTGASTGPHLHFETDRGAPGNSNSVDPSPLLAVG